MGRKIVLTGTTLTDTTAPRLATVDPMESAGSLLLIDYAHPKNTLDEGVPEGGAAIPNLMAGNLATLSGESGDALDGTFHIGGDIDNGTLGKVERSGKGGIHVIVSQANALASGDGVAVQAPEALYAYLAANPSHHYYISAWDRLTRADKKTGSTSAYLYSSGSNTTAGLVNVYAVNAFTPGGWLQVTAPGNVVGRRRTAIAVTGFVANLGHTAQRSGFPLWGAPANTMNAQLLSTRNKNWPSFIAYRLYVEDLTVSGRTHTEVDALDQALYHKHVLTPGGRYHGDTFTDPATIP